MNRAFVRSFAKVLAGFVAVFAISVAPAGCAQKKCGGCSTEKHCPKDCHKPCCKKDCPPGCTKPCCKKDGAAKP